MVQLGTFAPPGVGYSLPTKEGYVMNRTAATLTIGEVVMVDIKASDGGFGGNASAAAYVANTVIGSQGHPLNNVLSPTTAGIGVLTGGTGDPGYPLAVVTGLDTGAPTPGADDTVVKVMFQGFCQVKMAGTVGAGEYGKVIFPANGVRTATATTTAAVRAFGRILQNTSTANTNALCFVDGLSGTMAGALFAS